MTNIDIDLTELVSVLNSQIASYNLELQVARLQIDALQKKVKELEENRQSTQFGSPVKD